MLEKDLSFNEVHDVYAFRIIVDDVDTCYRVVGTVHSLYRPVPGKFKDYVAIPKSNGYQSLHTVLFGPYGVPLEVQIRTNDMNDVAEVGMPPIGCTSQVPPPTGPAPINAPGNGCSTL